MTGWLFLALALLPQEDIEDPALAAEAFEVAEGLEVGLFAAEPWFQNPVALSVDGRGRVHVVESHRFERSVFDVTDHPEWLPDDLGLRTVADRRAFLLKTFEDNPRLLTADAEIVRRLIDVNGNGRADAGASILSGFERAECGSIGGVLARREGVLVGCVPDLVRVKEGGRRERLLTGFGVHIGRAGHDLHGLILGPDGRLYFTMGDRGAHVGTRDAGTFELQDTGAVLRCEPDGTGLEVVAVGLRNPRELAFDDRGRLFTIDDDTAGEDRSRVLHIVPGGDYGWRSAYEYMPDFGPWIDEGIWRGDAAGGLPGAGHVTEDPTGLTFDPGTGFGERWRGCFFAGDATGGVFAFRIEAEGASFRTTEAERVLWNLKPTDVDFGPDGALFVSAWPEPGKGRLWRLTDGRADAGDEAFAKDTARILATDLDPLPIADRIDMLGHPDRRVRSEAHLSLGRGGKEAVEALGSVLDLDFLPDPARLHAVWALGISLRREGHEAAAQALTDATRNGDPDVRGAAMRLVGELRVEGARSDLVDALGNEHPTVAFEAALALARLGPRDPIAWLGRSERTPSTEELEGGDEVGEALARLLRERGDDAFLAHAGTLALLAWYGDEDLTRFAEGESPVLRSCATSALRRAHR